MRTRGFLFFLIIILLFFLGNNFCFALELEVSYPTLASGETITETTRLPEYLKYVFNFGILIGFLAVFVSLIIAGILYLVSPASPGARAKANDRLFGAISGLILLICLYLIVTTINPELKFFKVSEILEMPGLFLVGGDTRKPLGLSGISDTDYIKPPKSKIAFTQIEYSCAEPNGPTLIAYFYEESFHRKVEKEMRLNCGALISVEGKSFDFRYEEAGVYLYQTNNCAIPSEQPPRHVISNISALGELENKINSVKIQHIDPDYYIAVLYELVDFRGRCYYINPIDPCDNLDDPEYGPPFSAIASSVSVYRYEHDPKEGSVIFYRKSSYNSEGGIKEIQASEIKGIYMGKLEELQFDNVPKEEQDCVKWDFASGQPENNYCTEWKSPNLAGENISSIKINGNYFVLFISYDLISGEWGSCQEFPTPDDVNKEGPKQIKWEYINYPGRYPNYVFIFPVKEK